MVPSSAEAEIMVRVSTTVEETWRVIEDAVAGRVGIETVKETASEPGKVRCGSRV